MARELSTSTYAAGIAYMIAGDTQDILNTWLPKATESRWALAFIYKTEGHSYRKAGAFTLVSEYGDQLGVLSGGCLEADIRLMGQKAIGLNKNLYKEYDGRDDEDIAYQLGCGGIAWIAFYPLSEDNQFLSLNDVAEALKRHEAPVLSLTIDESISEPQYIASHVGLTASEEPSMLNINIAPKCHLLVVGGGQDAIPVCSFAQQLGWNVTVWDPRGAYARQASFGHVATIAEMSAEDLHDHVQQKKINFAVLMSHNVDIDAQALRCLGNTSLNHIALLGPKKRFKDVVAASGMHEDGIKPALSGPAGLDIGGDLPASIALSIVAKFHAIHHRKLG